MRSAIWLFFKHLFEIRILCCPHIPYISRSSYHNSEFFCSQAIFMAAGPSFKSGLVVDPFENIELYGMFAGE